MRGMMPDFATFAIVQMGANFHAVFWNVANRPNGLKDEFCFHTSKVCMEDIRG